MPAAIAARYIGALSRAILEGPVRLALLSFALLLLAIAMARAETGTLMLALGGASSASPQPNFWRGPTRRRSLSPMMCLTSAR
ncbi:MAG: hypothetical protein M5U16_14000 [Hyphomicrobium sp.]|nr:hypothetical protein [Hyphomicrobium sp.]